MAYLTPTRHPLSSREDGLYSDYADEVRSWAKKEIEMLQKENKELAGYKKGYYRLKEEKEETQSKLDEMYEFSYFKKLKKAEAEIKKLKEEIKEYEHESCESLAKEQKLYGQIFQLKKEVNDGALMFNAVVMSETEKVEKIDKLEAEIKKLKEELIQKIESHLSEQESALVALKRMNKENKELNQEINKLKRVIKEYEEDEQYMYDVKDEHTTYYLGDDLDEARKHSQVSGVEIKRYIVEEGEPNFGDWDIVS